MKFIQQIEPFITEDDIKAINEYLRSGGWLTEFKKTAEFGQMIADFLGVKQAVVVTSGTVALYLSLLALGIGPNDSVIVPNYTMIAGPNSVKWTGADVILSDVEKDTLCLDLSKVELKKSTKAMMYVSINGRSGNMDEVTKFCKDNNLFLLEDACQAFGSKWNNKFLGTFGDVAVFSFTPHKIITTGQGGAVVTNNHAIYQKVKKLKDFHRTAPATDWHDGIGFNFKFTDLQAVIGIEQMKIIDFRVKKKKGIYRKYRELLDGVTGVEMLPVDIDQTPPWFVDIILPSQEKRDRMIACLKENNIGSRPFYPPINHQPIYSDYPKGNFPISEGIVNRGLWLPSSIGLKDEVIEYVCQKVRNFLKDR